jgi:hypothetical protein
MMDSGFQATAIALVIGFSLIAFGILGRQGWRRTRPLYMETINPLVAAVDAIYGATAVGVGFVLVGAGLALDNAILTGIGLGGGVIAGFVLMIWKPRWLIPEWLLWLKESYDDDTIKYMFTQVRHNRSQYRRVQKCNQEQFEMWAQEMAERYKHEVQQSARG